MSGIERIVVDCATPVRNSKDAAYSTYSQISFHPLRDVTLYARFPSSFSNSISSRFDSRTIAFAKFVAWPLLDISLDSRHLSARRKRHR